MARAGVAYLTVFYVALLCSHVFASSGEELILRACMEHYSNPPVIHNRSRNSIEFSEIAIGRNLKLWHNLAL